MPYQTIQECSEPKNNKKLVQCKKYQSIRKLQLLMMLLANLKKDLNSQRQEVALFRVQLNSLCQIEQKQLADIANNILKHIASIAEELRKSKQTQLDTKKQVLQLQQMINQFVTSYSKEIEMKNIQNERLKAQLKTLKGHLVQNAKGHQSQHLKNTDNLELAIIQEESQTTNSYPISERDSSLNLLSVYPLSEKSETAFPLLQTKQQNSLFSRPKTTESPIKKQKIFFQKEKKIDKSLATIQNKDSIKQSQRRDSRNELYSQENVFGISKSSSQSELLHLGDTDKINIPRVSQSPKKMMFLKKKQKMEDYFSQLKENTSFDKNAFSSDFHGKIMARKKNNSNKSFFRPRNSSSSKEKLKISSKIIEEYSQHQRKNSQSKKKLALPSTFNIKQLFCKLKRNLLQYIPFCWKNVEIVKYQGSRKNAMRWGKGRLVYSNSMIYEGGFKENCKHGHGTITLNGALIFQGEWAEDQITGEGHINSMKIFSQNCPPALSSASYCGQLLQGQLQGMGTLFLNENQKIVTKFNENIPYGELTYYSKHEIEFGVWPTE